MIASPLDRPVRHRLQLQVKGVVQGVGFRPYVYRLAHALDLTGWVCNSSQGVLIEVEGAIAQLQTFQTRLPLEKPAHAHLHTIEATWTEAVGYPDFTIQASQKSLPSPQSALILPDLATCVACLADIFDPTNRHYRYPFTNCTYCGPRLTILRSLPYDRAHTTLKDFSLCSACQGEYDDPRDRRFHAQPNACPHCGPHLELWNRAGQAIASSEEALQQAVKAVQAGQILALKGLGGFHLLVDARNQAAVQTLRDRKHRPHKPLAVMFPSLEQVRDYCSVSPLAAQMLASAAAPIVILPRHDRTAFLAEAIAPHNPTLGVLLPYTPLHHLLMAELGFPVVATSGNRSGEPIVIDEIEALQTLVAIVDVFLVHNRPIARPVDDSIVQILGDKAQILRRARGYTPLPIALPPQLVPPNPEVILAVGGHVKNTVALYVHQQLLVSQHLGDLDCRASCDRFQQTIQDLCRLYHTTPTIIACDAHPDYYSSQYARSLVARRSQVISSPPETPRPRLISVQHHYAHVLSGLADNQWQPPVLGIAWDGTGYGLDGTIWGGEWLWLPAEPLPEPGFIRAAHLRPFPLPGAEKAVKEPRRSALGLLYECLDESGFESMTQTLELAPLSSFLPQEPSILKTMLQRDLNCPRTSSMGRLFDAIASLLDLCQQTSFEGQAALSLEWAIAGHVTDAVYPYGVDQSADHALQFDYAPMVRAILEDLGDLTSPRVIAATFHNTLVAGLVDLACRIRTQYPELKQVMLTGGCFQNRYLLARACDRLQQQGFVVGCHQQVPSNDGGISTGQVMAALRYLKCPTNLDQIP